MPRKPTQHKRKLTVVVNGAPITVTLHPPSGRKTSWYVYWPGLKFTKSTGCRDYSDAVSVAENMLRGNGKKSQIQDAIPSDEEFDEVQRRHFGKKKDPAAQKRAEKSLKACMEAVTAFRQISGLSPITVATPDDCERFQHSAIELPKNWRSEYPNSKSEVETLSPNTIIKWSVALQAAFERVNSAAGKKCVRGIVPESRLLTENPWRKFNWIEGQGTKIRQFDDGQLVSLLDYLDSKWGGVEIAPLIAKVCLWSWGRKTEVMGLSWESLRAVNDEYHFEIIGKRGIDKWFRIPKPLFHELMGARTDSRFVFAAYNEQLRKFHECSLRPWLAAKVNHEFDPVNLGDWFYERIRDWSASFPDGPACTHIFRKATLQYARSGEDLNRQVAADARLGENVMMTNYVKESDPEMRQKSNRTFQRIVASLSPEVAKRYGYEPPKTDSLKNHLQDALNDENWDLASKLAAELAKQNRNAG